jgi:hypothetical protein
MGAAPTPVCARAMRLVMQNLRPAMKTHHDHEPRCRMFRLLNCQSLKKTIKTPSCPKEEMENEWHTL